MVNQILLLVDLLQLLSQHLPCPNSLLLIRLELYLFLIGVTPEFLDFSMLFHFQRMDQMQTLLLVKLISLQLLMAKARLEFILRLEYSMTKQLPNLF